MSDISTNVLPVFLLIMLGWLMVRSGYMLAEANFHNSSPLRLWVAYFGAVAITWTAAHLAATRIFHRERQIGVLAGVSSAFANNVFIGLPLVGRLVGDSGIVALSILLAVHLPL